MATRSLVARRNADDTYTAIYVHWNGYVAGNGYLLQRYYADDAAVASLLALGSLSELGATPGEPHTFSAHDRMAHGDDGFAAWCLAYGRDRGDTTEGAGVPWQLATIEALIATARAWDAEYVYVWHCAQWWLLGRDGALSSFDGAAALAADQARYAV